MRLFRKDGDTSDFEATEAAPRRDLPGKVRRFFGTRLIVAGIAVGAGTAATVTLLAGLNRMVPLDSNPLLSVAALIATLGSAHVAYVLYVRWFEKRSAEELAWRAAPRGLAAGFGIGTGILLLTLGTLALLGHFRIEGSNPGAVLAPAAVGALITAYIEELAFRGIFFRIVEEGLGTWTALGLSAVIFGLLHANRPNATWSSTLAIIASAGLLLGAAFVFSRRLWLPIGIHFAWNFTQGGIFGVAVSGDKQPGLLVSELTGPVLVSGGEFGAEGSVFVPLIAGALAVWLLRRAAAEGHLVHGPWNRSEPVLPGGPTLAASADGAVDPRRPAHARGGNGL